MAPGPHLGHPEGAVQPPEHDEGPGDKPELHHLGVEIVADRVTQQTDPATTTAIVNGLRERRVLISATGEDGSVLKIRPPLVFSEADATRLVTELDAVLTSLR